MRIPFFSMFTTSPFDGLQEHAEKVKECSWAFQQAVECYISNRCKTFEDLRQEVIKLESEADAIKRRIRGHLPKGTMMPVDKFQLFRYLREQDHVLDSVQDTLDWLSYRKDGIPADSTRRGAFKTFRYFQKHTQLFKKQKRFSLYKANQV